MPISFLAHKGGIPYTPAHRKQVVIAEPDLYLAMRSSAAPLCDFAAGRDFKISSGEVIITWIVPEAGEAFIQLPGQASLQTNN